MLNGGVGALELLADGSSVPVEGCENVESREQHALQCYIITTLLTSLGSVLV